MCGKLIECHTPNQKYTTSYKFGTEVQPNAMLHDVHKKDFFPADSATGFHQVFPIGPPVVLQLTTRNPFNGKEENDLLYIITTNNGFPSC